jgi:hypothetical protein
MIIIYWGVMFSLSFAFSAPVGCLVVSWMLVRRGEDGGKKEAMLWKSK